MLHILDHPHLRPCLLDPSRASLFISLIIENILEVRLVRSKNGRVFIGGGATIPLSAFPFYRFRYRPRAHFHSFFPFHLSMLLPHILSTLLLLIIHVNTDDLPCIFSPNNVSSTKRSCNKFNHTDGPVLVSRRRFRRQAGRSGLGGCGNTEIKSVSDTMFLKMKP